MKKFSFQYTTKSFMRNAYISSLAGKDFITIGDLSNQEFKGLIDLAAQYKRIYKEEKNISHKPLDGKNMAMIFQKRSTRTRISTEVGMLKLGGQALFLSSDDIQLGVNESLKDTARVLSRFNDLILARVYEHSDIMDLAKEASVPVINALSDMHHPLQTLADYLTLQERFGDLKNKTISWVGDGNNVLHDLMIGASKIGMHVHVATPKGYEADENIVRLVKKLGKENNTKVLFTNDPVEAVTGAHVVVTDTWISMGQEEESAKRIKDFHGYQVSLDLLQHASTDWTFLHCLPRHKEEVDDEVFYSDRSLVFDEAENRMWTVMAVISALLGKA